MTDPRMVKLANLLIAYSTRIQPGEKVLVEAVDIPVEITELLVERIAAAGGLPFVETTVPRLRRAFYRHAGPEQFQTLCRRDLAFMGEMQAYIGLRGGANSFELADVPTETLRLADEHWLRPVTDRRVDYTKWCVLRWPTPAMAQLAGMSTAAFGDFYFRVCTLDYARMAAAEEPLAARLRAADRIEIRGPGGTDLRFSVKGIGVKKCCGLRNLPDGELFSAPVRDSVEGVIAYNAPTLYQGKPFDHVRLVFRQGRIVEATASDTPGLNAVLDSDEGARFIGEFSFGFNPHIRKPMRDALFDEKIAGSIHLTPGQAYKETDNGNRSKIHWDLVLIQTPEYGGGEIRIDGELIRQDGRFMPADLQGLNPEALAGEGNPNIQH